MAIRVTGMNSGLDTDSIIQELVKASSEKKTKLEKAQTKLSWKQETWKSLNTKIHSFFKKTIDNLRFSMAYKKKATTVSNESVASVVASDNAVSGTRTLEVDKLAKAGDLTGGTLITKSGGKATSKTKLSELGTGGMDAAGAGISVTIGGKTTNLSLSSDSTIDDVVNQLNKAGVNANFDSANQRIFVSAQKSGKENDFSITANTTSGLSALANLGLLTQGETGEGTEAARWSAYQGSTDAETLNNLKAAGEISKRETERAQEYLRDSKNRIKENASSREEMAKLEKTYEESFKEQTKGVFENSKNQAIFAAAGLTDFGSTDSLADMDAKKLQDAAKALADEYNKLVESPTDTMTEEELAARSEKMIELQQEIAKLNSAREMKTEYQSYADAVAANETQLADNATYINELELDADGNYKIVTTTDAEGNETEAATATSTEKLTQSVGEELVNKVNTAAQMSAYDVTGTASATAVRINGQDAEIKLNGAQYTSTSNNFTVNGLTITAKELTNGSPVSIVTSEDVDGVYNVIKDFLKGYNELIKEMDTLYNGASAKGYEPLTSEEKESMSEDEIEKWEQKIKDSLLRRDTTLGTVVNSMKGIMLDSYSVNGKSMSLADFGIATLGYFGAAENEKGMYHIDGDSEDANTASEKDKLKTLIASDPDTVTSFFTQLTGKLYDELDKQMKSSDFRSVYHVYDDKKMQKEYDEYTKKIKAQETKLKALEDRYYKQFSAMEVALSKMESSKSAVASMLGGG